MRTLLSTLLCMLLLVSNVSLFAQTQQKGFQPAYATVLTNKVNIRAGSGLNFEILGQLKRADEVVVTGQQYDWYKITLPKEALCFVHKDYINQGVVQTNRLHVRAGKGANFNVVGLLNRGSRVSIMEENGDWLRITPVQGCSGWVRKDYLRLSGKKVRPPFQRNPAQKKIEVWGEVSDLGKIVNRQGTHKLIEGNKVLYYLKSKRFNLNHYVYQKVGLKGTLIDAKDSPYPVIDVEQITERQRF